MDATEQPPALRSPDYQEIGRCLDEALAIFNRRTGLLNLSELRTKSILGALREEMKEREQSSQSIEGWRH